MGNGPRHEPVERRRAVTVAGSAPVMSPSPSRYPAAPYSPGESGRHPMSKDPDNTSQVQAYRFVLRRMESALVRKDAVMLHEPMRHHLQVSMVGLLLGILGLAVFFVIGLF